MQTSDWAKGQQSPALLWKQFDLEKFENFHEVASAQDCASKTTRQVDNVPEAPWGEPERSQVSGRVARQKKEQMALFEHLHVASVYRGRQTGKVFVKTTFWK